MQDCCYCYRIPFVSLEDDIKATTKQIRSLHAELLKQTKKQIYGQFSGKYFSCQKFYEKIRVMFTGSRIGNFNDTKTKSNIGPTLLFETR